MHHRAVPSVASRITDGRSWREAHGDTSNKARIIAEDIRVNSRSTQDLADVN